MLIDLFNPENTVSYNIKAAHALGLHAAIYCAILSAVKAKAIRKEKIEKGFFRIDRKFVTDESTLSVNDQLTCDVNLEKLGILKRDKEDNSKLSFDEKLYSAIIMSEEFNFDEMTKNAIKEVKEVIDKKETKQLSIIKTLQKCITETNEKILLALRNWVEAVCVSNRGRITSSVISDFQKDIKEYANGDVDLAVKIIKIATAHAWVESRWAINSYEKDNQVKQQQSKTTVNQVVRMTEQKKVDKSKLTNIIF